MTEESGASVPRTVWTAWLQGLDGAPPLVERCVRSWRDQNPRWRVVVLTDATLGQHADPAVLAQIDALDLPVQKRANLLRLHVLATQGGIWADATCLCTKPLDSWLPSNMPSGFFAFRLPGDPQLRAAGARGRRDRVVANWFLASQAGNPLTVLFFEQHLALMRTLTAVKRGARVRRAILALTHLTKRSARASELWAHPTVARILRVYPYFIFHYHFAYVMRRDPRCAAVWQRTPVIDGTPLLEHRTAEAVEAVDADDLDIPLVKLHWR